MRVATQCQSTTPTKAFLPHQRVTTEGKAMEELITSIKNIQKEAENAFSYCAMPFDRRMDAINEWNRLLCPDNVKMLIEALEEKDKEIECLQEANYLLQEQIE